MINISFNSTTVATGELLKGYYLWNPSHQQAKKNTKLLVGWRTEGRGTIEQKTIYEIQIEPDIRCYFECTIPLAGPISYDGQLLRIIWEVSFSLSEWMGLKKQKESEVFRVIPRTIY